MNRRITIRGAREHNLRDVDLDLPRDQLIVITGVSGSGKSSLARDTIFREGQRRYLESLSMRARLALGKLRRPDVERLDGLSPALAVDQRTVVRSPRSTVGTLSGLYDLLRLLFARVGVRPDGALDPRPTSSLFSFNHPAGACAECRGLGVTDRVDPQLLVADETRSLRQGAMVPTTPSGYIVYSQVTLDVLNLVCQQHGFDIDVPWRDLDAEQQRVVLHGSDRIRIPFGKHPLENRLKWSGITAKPREEGYYKGIVPVIEEILKRSRNKNALRFVRSVPCRACGGRRLAPGALSVLVGGHSIAHWSALTLDELDSALGSLQLSSAAGRVAEPLVDGMRGRLQVLRELGLGYLELRRESTTLSAGESRRIRLATQVGSGLHRIIYVLDEPSVGLHSQDNQRLLGVLRRLRDNGNTVVVVEHDSETLAAADWLVDLGPGAAAAGGQVLFSGPPAALMAGDDPQAATSITRAFLAGERGRIGAPSRRIGNGWLEIQGASHFNLRDVDARFALGALNVVSGVSGAGKSTLVDRVLARALRRQLNGAKEQPGRHRALVGAGAVDKLIVVDQAPIGRTPRSNPATYTKLFDPIRALFAALPDARARGWGKGRFSFNNKGGRCEACQGAGVVTVGMHFLGDVEIPCEACHGRRFNEQTLTVRFQGHSVRDVLETTVDEAAELFRDHPTILRILRALQSVGLGYLRLGQPSTTVSGGEAQRIKLAAELARPSRGHTLYILDEPTTGLHRADVEVLLTALDRLVERGHTVVVVEHDLDVLLAADRILDLGPGSAAEGGRLVASGTPEEVAAAGGGPTARVLQGALAGHTPVLSGVSPAPVPPRDIELTDVTTHNLRHVDVVLPAQRLTVITGPSGSGKSSLAFDTLVAEGRNRFAESLSAHARRQLGLSGRAQVVSVQGLTPTIAIGQRTAGRNPRSTVGTMTGILDHLRLVYARAGERRCPDCGAVLTRGACPECPYRGPASLTSSGLSFNDKLAACPTCRGLGSRTTCDPHRLITDTSRPLPDGAMAGHATGKFYGDADGQHMAILHHVGQLQGLDYSVAWDGLTPAARELALWGTGERRYEVTWHYRRQGRTGDHVWTTTWDGLCAYVDEEYQRKHADHRGEKMAPLMQQTVCPDCAGKRLAPPGRSVFYGGRSLPDLLDLPVGEARRWLGTTPPSPVTRQALADVDRRLAALEDVGLDYLALDRGAPTLSGGEAQRVRMAAQLDVGLCGITYVLDEPTVGLHPRDTHRLVQVMQRLRDAGNTVVVVEHDLDVVRAADHVIDLGPGAGLSGGQVVATGSPAQLVSDRDSPTGRALAAEPNTALNTGGEQATGLRIRGACAHNLTGVDVDLPSGALVAVTGVSGSGKSALLFDVIGASAAAGSPRGCETLDGLEQYDAVVQVDSSPIPAAPTSTPATACGAFDLIRGVFAATDEARARSFKKGRFAFNGKAGQCPTCKGRGRVRVEMGFLPDVWSRCDSCQGQRYEPQTLAVSVLGRSIADVLAMNVTEAAAFFTDGKLAGIFAVLEEVGLGYLPLGQPGDTLSGGEAQRLKLARELITASRRKGGTRLYLLDEPTTGLHASDVAGLLTLLLRLVEQGHTVVAIEHHLDIIRAADRVVDLGPDGGARGGRLVAQGSPAALAAAAGTATGKALAALTNPAE